MGDVVNTDRERGSNASLVGETRRRRKPWAMVAAAVV